MPDLETRVAVLEHELETTKENISNSLMNLESDISEIKKSISVMSERINEIDKKLEAQFVKYNGYSERFATKFELFELKNDVDKMKAEMAGRNSALIRIGSALGIVSTLILIVQYFIGL